MPKSKEKLQSTQPDSYTLQARAELITTASENIYTDEYIKRCLYIPPVSSPVVFSWRQPAPEATN